MICMYGDSLHLSIHKPPVRAYFSHLDWNPNKAAWCNKNETKLWSCWFSVVNCVAVIVNHTGVCPFGSLRSGRAILLNTCTEVDHFSRESSNKIQREKQNLLPECRVVVTAYMFYNRPTKMRLQNTFHLNPASYLKYVIRICIWNYNRNPY